MKKNTELYPRLHQVSYKINSESQNAFVFNTVTVPTLDFTVPEHPSRLGAALFDTGYIIDSQLGRILNHHPPDRRHCLPALAALFFNRHPAIFHCHTFIDHMVAIYLVSTATMQPGK